MRELTDEEKGRLWDEVREEFPDDDTMQQVHYVRLLHHCQTRGLSVAEHIHFFADSGKPAGV